MRSRRPVSLGLGATVVGLALALAGCASPVSRDDGEQTQVGQVRRVQDRAVGTPSVVAVPLGTLRFTVSKPGRRLADVTDAAAVSGQLRAPDGASLVAIGWTSQVSTGNAALLTSGVRRKPTISLVAGGRTYPITDDWVSLGQDSRVVTVRGRPDDLRLRVSYDGYAQTVDVRRSGPTPDQLRGPAGPLYRDATTQQRLGCPEWTDAVEDRRGFVSLSGQCSAAGYDPVAYVAGAGWAPEGRHWVVVDLVLYGEHGGYWTPDGGPVGVSYDVRSADDVRVRLDGRSPDAVVPVVRRAPGEPGPTPTEGDAPRSNLRYVFAVDDHARPGTLTFSRTYRFAVDRVEKDGVTGYPVTPTLTYTGRLELG